MLPRLMGFSQPRTLVTSPGGMGCTYIIESLTGKIRTNRVDDFDGLKHCPDPMDPRFNVPNLSVIFIWNDPLKAILSHARRGWLWHQCRKLGGKLQAAHSLESLWEACLEEGADVFGVRNHAENWLKSGCRRMFFLDTRHIERDRAKLGEFVGLSLDELASAERATYDLSIVPEGVLPIYQELDRLVVSWGEERNAGLSRDTVFGKFRESDEGRSFEKVSRSLMTRECSTEQSSFAARMEPVPPALSEWVNRYHGNRDSGWFVESFPEWRGLFGESWNAVRVLETGAADGVSANLMLDGLFFHPQSELHAVDLYDGAAGEARRAVFRKNAIAGGHAHQLHLYEGATREVLAWMIATEEYWESFDFIHLNGAKNAAEILADACQAWSLLKIGGIIILEGMEQVRVGIAAFHTVYGEQTETLMEGEWVALLRKE